MVTRNPWELIRKYDQTDDDRPLPFVRVDGKCSHCSKRIRIYLHTKPPKQTVLSQCPLCESLTWLPWQQIGPLPKPTGWTPKEENVNKEQRYGQRLFVVLSIIEVDGPLELQSLHEKVKNNGHNVHLRTLRRDLELLAKTRRVNYDENLKIIASKNQEIAAEFLGSVSKA